MRLVNGPAPQHRRRCVSPEAGWILGLVDRAYENQTLIGADNISSKIQSYATDKGLDGMQLGRCVETKATEAEVDKSVAEGHQLQVSATPPSS